MRAYVLFLASCMLISGSLNTIVSKFQDTILVPDRHGGVSEFRHPAVQSAQMFFGEFSCLLPVSLLFLRKHFSRSEDEKLHILHRQANKSWWDRNASYFVFAIPALCDATATTMLNLGLIYTQASVFQMLRGTLVFFAGLLTIVVLKRKLHSYNWLGMLLVVTGATICGYSSVHYAKMDAASKTTENFANGTLAMMDASDRLSPPPDRLFDELSGYFLKGPVLEGEEDTPVDRDDAASKAALALFGDVLIVCSQMGTAMQFVLEEKFIRRYKVQPLFAVGMEGFWGVLYCAMALPLLQVFNIEDSADAWYKMTHSSELLFSTLLSVVSIACVNGFGVALTRAMSGAARATIDACRTLVVWVFALYLGWENFHWLQVSGFVVLVSGTSIYNSILKVPCLTYEVPEPRVPHSRRPSTRRNLEGASLAAYDPLAQDHLAPLLQGNPAQEPSQPGSVAVPISAGHHSPAHMAIPPVDSTTSLSSSVGSPGTSLARIGTSMQWLVHSFRRPYFGSPNR
mmetsp:Transcript_15856/g.34383  ORF Transcript_15856/g.34383 Transcript_15856/m.34383 type:complete len:513 (-) Transcript_15856:246-1784(-)|eukprot:CAMPEP_0118937580 /NCGR_PEP_ID=MMETSP1169-20130426/23187_1 /TAXON_ID=36882 /ORGANISM="Pyramimonas obovata, Strain CCMP722" /LENGTH=512 /DNA_ID=CAMNT_0006881257 /DNA_START=102 /DNA_END=1640 /DNA_ORIENTATION=+